MQYLLLIPALYALLCVTLALLQRRLLYSPTKDWIATPDDLGLDHEDVWMNSSSGEKVHAWYIAHPNPRGAVLFCHGNGGNNSHRLDSLRLMQDLGLSVLIFDYPGYGQSGGSPKQKSMMASGQAARDWLEARPENSGVPILIWGRSLGGAVAALLAGIRQPSLLIIESSFPDMASVAGRLYPYLPVRLLLADRWLAADSVRHVDCPKLIVHSQEDELIPYILGEQLFAAAADPKILLPIHGNHEGGWFDSGETYTAEVVTFLNDNLDPPA
jgi:uncharacterized protein